MQVQWPHGVLELVLGDITEDDSDAIVNAANERLVPGGGVDGAITRAAGPEALAARRQLGGCPTGEARIGPGGALRARYIIYTVGPIYYDGQRGEPMRLAGAYRSSMALAQAHGLRSLAFPAISTGIFGYPLEAAATVALGTIRDTWPECPAVERVRFVLFDRRAYDVHAEVLQRRAG